MKIYYKYINILLNFVPNATGVAKPALFFATIVKTGAQSILRSYFPSISIHDCPKSRAFFSQRSSDKVS